MSYTWKHALPGEAERLSLMSDVLDPWTRFHISQLPLEPGWRCVEVGAGDGSVSLWLASQLTSEGHVLAVDIDLSLLPSAQPTNFTSQRMDLTQERLAADSYDLVMARATLHHLPNRHEVLDGLYRAVRPGGYLFVEEPDFYPTLTATPKQLANFWVDFLDWAAVRDIDYHVGRKIPVWLQRLGAENIESNAHTIVHSGGSAFARWWQSSIQEVAPLMLAEGATTQNSLDEFMAFYDDESLWTMSIAWTATTARKPISTGIQ